MTPSLKADIAHIDDVDQLVKLDEICFETDRLSTKQFRHFIRSTTSQVVVVKEAKKMIAGAVLLFRKNSNLARIYSIAVLPEFRKQGVAQILIHLLETICLQRACIEIRLEVKKDNQYAINFYHKNGYMVFGEYKNFYEDGNDALRMRKIILFEK